MRSFSIPPLSLSIYLSLLLSLSLPLSPPLRTSRSLSPPPCLCPFLALPVSSSLPCSSLAIFTAGVPASFEYRNDALDLSKAAKNDYEYSRQDTYFWFIGTRIARRPILRRSSLRFCVFGIVHARPFQSSQEFSERRSIFAVSELLRHSKILSRGCGVRNDAFYEFSSIQVAFEIDIQGNDEEECYV